MEKAQKAKKNRFHLIKWHLHNQDYDIKYRGPLSYRHMRILAWIFMMCMAMSVVFSAFIRFKHAGGGIKTASDVLSIIGTLALPMFLVANFSIIMRSHKDVKKILLTHALMALAMLIACYVIVFRFYFTITTKYDNEAYPFMAGILETLLNSNPSKFVYLNIFIDLLLCSLSYLFLTYEPKKHFKGKKLIIFRLFVLLPILYEFACIYVKLHVFFNDEFIIPWYIFPLLTTKPPLLLFSFLVLTLIFAIRKRRYLNKGHSEDEYDEYLKTNANSLQFSILTCVVLVLAIILDTVIASICAGSLAARRDIPTETAIAVVQTTGLGKCFPVLFILPIIMLFSYTRSYENKLIDMVIPVVGLGFCIYSVLETAVQLWATL